MNDNPRYAAPPDEFPKKGTSANGGDVAYTVEARLAYLTPKIVAGRLLDLRWTRIDFEPAQTGVPVKDALFPNFQTMGLLSYQAAQALRWWFIAEASRTYDHLCVETRLIQHKVQYSFSEVAERACEYVGGDEDRSHIRPSVAVTQDKRGNET